MLGNRPEYVVGIGASAGGLEALERFFETVPLDTRMAFVVVQHLSPDFKSLMSELLARRTTLPIQEVEDGMMVEADHVYLIPAKKEMIVSDGRLLLCERDRHQELSLPIDIFFRSLAQDCGPRAVAVVLSGTGSDGSRGIRDVHEAGGMVIVQDVESAQFDGMPRAAYDVGVADWMLRPEEMPQVIIDHARTTGGDAPLAATEVRALETVYRILQEEFSLDFTQYKPSTVTRRLARRLQLSNAEDVDAYVQRLRNERDELDTLYRDLLIGVTRFFRDEDAFHALEQKVIPDLLRKTPTDEPIRIWVAGCATGEEAYSLAMLFHEATNGGKTRPVKIFATDVHRGSLEIASNGIYEAQTLERLSPARRSRFFRERGGLYQVVPEVRQMIVFAPHNVIRDAPFTRVDLVTCRNLLIYLQPPAQQKALGLFHFALNRGGYLFLGPSESPGAIGASFETVDRTWRIHRKFSDVRTPVDARLRPRTFDGRTGMIAPFGAARIVAPTPLLPIYDKLLDEHMPPSLLVSERGELVHAFNGASRFLQLKDGRPVLDIREATSDELRLVLLGGLQRALRNEGGVVFKGVRTSIDPPEKHDVSVRRVDGRPGGSHVLITFSDMKTAPVSERTETEVALDDVSRDRLSALESELSYAKESLQAAIEELQTSNEELQAANEELLASNEELQSTNEELQSVNEELYTVNAEYQRKIAELTELTNDMDNLLASTDIGAIFLDRDLTIRKFTPQIAETFRLVAHDIGRPIETFASSVNHVTLVDDLKSVLATGKPIERELTDRRERPFFMRVLPYRAKGTIEGVVLTLIDVRGLKEAEDALFHERYLLNSLLQSVRDPIYFKDSLGRFIRANHALSELLGVSDPSEAVGKTAFELVPDDQALALQTQDDLVLRGGEPQHERLEKRVLPDGRVEWHLVTRLPLRDRADRIVGVTGIFRNVTDQKRAEERNQEAVRLRDQFLAMLSHELRNPLGAMVTATSLLGPSLRGNERSQRLLGILERQSTQMARLLDDLLEVSRVTQNKIELRRLPVDLGAVAREAVEAVRPLIDARNVKLTVDIEPRALIVDGDGARLQQIQVNLLNNAAKYTPPGGHVWLDVRREGGDAVILVRDDGAGIAPDMLDSVFELFVQSRRTLDRSEGGIGVGLTLVRSLVEMHGGTIEGQSEGEGKGASFIVRLPLIEQPTVDHQTGKRRSLDLPANARIAIVEDNVDSCQMLCELLGFAGFHCDSANDGPSGLALIERMKPDVAIVDVGLPGMNGFDIARELRSDSANAKIYLIALTGYGQPADRQRARESGFDEHIVKPVRPDQLLELLGRGNALLRTEKPERTMMVDGGPPPLITPIEPNPDPEAE